MATMLDGESYVGRVLVRPVSSAGDVTLYCWPLRCLKGKFGGPTFGLDVKGEEILRFDPHGSRGHWHKNGYDKLGAEAPTRTSPKAWSIQGPSSPGPWSTSARTPRSSWWRPVIPTLQRRWTPRCWPRP